MTKSLEGYQSDFISTTASPYTANAIDGLKSRLVDKVKKHQHQHQYQHQHQHQYLYLGHSSAQYGSSTNCIDFG